MRHWRQDKSGMGNDVSLSGLARTRLRLAGGAVLETANPWFAPLDTLAAECAARHQPFVSFANYDYLGFAGNPAVRAAAISAIEIYGPSVSGSRLVGGQRSFHAAFEAEIASFLGSEAALTLVSGYLTNLTLIPHLMGPNDLILADEYCHNSIMKGARASGARLKRFRHNDIENARSILEQQRGTARRCLIVTEGLYSMDGDVVDLPAMLELKNAHECWLMVDEAHSLGVLGNTGRGVCEHFGIDAGEVDLIIGTLSKTLASAGGFIAARQDVIDWLRFTLPGFVYSVGLGPSTTAAARTSLALLRDQPAHVGRLQAVSAYFLEKSRAAGLNTGMAIGRGVVPVLFDDQWTTLAVADALTAAGIYAPPIVIVGVPSDAPRIRFFLSAAHREADIDRTIAVMATAREQVGAAGTQSAAS